MIATDLKIPTLETPRLILRGHRIDDFDAMVALYDDPIVMAHIHGQEFTREDRWSRLLRHLGHWAAFGFGLWAIEEKETGAYVGATGAFNLKRDMTPPMEDMPEAGWTLASRVHGRGYATEATLAALAWTDTFLNHPRMFCIIATENRPSIRVAEKCGFRLSGETLYKNEPTLIYLRDPA
jgi:RimJ/RimL family protein N-acetyltransferase